MIKIPLIVLLSTRMLFVANSTPIVVFDSRLNSFLVNLDRRLDFPTPESPIRTTTNKEQKITKTIFHYESKATIPLNK